MRLEKSKATRYRHTPRGGKRYPHKRGIFVYLPDGGGDQGQKNVRSKLGDVRQVGRGEAEHIIHSQISSPLNPSSSRGRGGKQ